MRGYRATHPALTYMVPLPQRSIPFRTKFFFTAVTLLILGLDIALAYGIYLIARMFL